MKKISSIRTFKIVSFLIILILIISANGVNAATSGYPKLNSFELNSNSVTQSGKLYFDLDYTKTNNEDIDHVEICIQEMGKTDIFGCYVLDNLEYMDFSKINIPPSKYKIVALGLYPKKGSTSYIGGSSYYKDSTIDASFASENVFEYNFPSPRFQVFQNPTVKYSTHVQDYGWQDYVSDGTMSGTSGRSKRLEAIKIKLENAPYDGDIEYRTHIQDIGWESSFKKNDTLSGTSHQSKRLEAIEIRLTGEMAGHYNVYYRVHAQDVGWMNWAKNGEQAGTLGYSRRLEGIEIVLVEKGNNPPTRTNSKTKKSFLKKQISYTTHVQDYGWQASVSDGAMSGTSHQSKRLEGIKINLYKPEVSGNVEYRTHVQDIGWETSFKKNGELSGTSHQSKRLEAITIKLTDAMAEKYDIYYRVHAETFGWMGWAKNGERAGTAHQSKRLEGIEVVLVEKGENPPERTDTRTKAAYVEYLS